MTDDTPQSKNVVEEAIKEALEIKDVYDPFAKWVTIRDLLVALEKIKQELQSEHFKILTQHKDGYERKAIETAGAIKIIVRLINSLK